MPNGVGEIGYCAINPGFGTGALMPMLPGSEFLPGRTFTKWETASSTYGPVNAHANLRTPLITLRLRVHPNWFNPYNIFQMFARDYTFGQLASLGSIQWRFGNQVAQRFAACKVDRFVIAWSDVGAPLEVLMAIRPYGARVPALSFLPFFYGGLQWSGRGVSYGGQQTQVASGFLSIDNRLRPDYSSPHYPSIDGGIYPTEYHSDSYDVQANISQIVGASRQLDTDNENLAAAMRLNFTGFGGAGVGFILNVLAPDHQEVYREGKIVNRRIYTTLKPDALTPQFRAVAI